MYDEIIEKSGCFAKELIDENFNEMLFAYNLHRKALDENGVVNDDGYPQYIFKSSDKKDIKSAIDIMTIDTFFKMVKEASANAFLFDETGKILDLIKVKNVLFDNYQYYMYETLAEPWLSEETQTLYKKLWNKM